MFARRLVPLLICKALLLISLHFSPGNAMWGEETAAGSTSLSSPYKRPRNNNKEKYELYKENFSSEADIDFSSLYKTLHYTFKSKDLLIEALYPLLPTSLQREKTAFDHLEFLGDSVLGLIIRERLLDLFPDEKRGMHNKLYVALVCNKTLADVYLHNLPIEAHLPYPGERACEYCNVVEALIGAVYQDSPPNDLTQSRKIIMRILDDHVLIQKRNDLTETSSLLLEATEPYGPYILPTLGKVITDLFEDPKNHHENPKSLLGMILGKTLQDKPRYELSLGKNEADFPVFVINVVGAQIGHKIQGIGFTRDEAEQDAARNAINFLAQDTRLPQKELSIPKVTYREFIHNYCQAQGLTLPRKEFTSLSSFTYQVKMGESVIGAETAHSKAKAREEAARQAYLHLTENHKSETEETSSKNYRSLLQEWVAQTKIVGLQFIEMPSQPSVHYRIKIGNDLLGEGEGPPKEAKEKAYHSIFEQLLRQQEDTHLEREARKASAKKVKQTSPATPQVVLSSESASLSQDERNETQTIAEGSPPTSQKQKKKRNRKRKRNQAQHLITTTTTSSLAEEGTL